MGIDRSQFSPALQAKITFAGSNNTSYAQASQNLDVLAELKISDKQVRRVCKAIGQERVAQRDAAVALFQAKPLAQRKAAPPGVTAPELAVVGVDGGRLQILERTAHSQVVPKEAETIEDDVAVPEPVASTRKPLHWREDKIGLLMTMTSERHQSDPCPDIPESFVNPEWISQLAKELKGRAAARSPETPSSDSEAATPTPPKPQEDKPAWKPPTGQAKYVVATRRPWQEFGPMVAERAWSLGFFAASRKAFVADGAANNWTLWRSHFSSFEPILDFIHALTYVYHAALAGRSASEGWTVYQRWVSWLWSGTIESIIVELALRQAEMGALAEDAKETSPAKVVARALEYLQNHKERMRYARYRREGLPIVSSYVESLVKQFNYRVKGTEKFWQESGAEEMLQLRGDHLSDDRPLDVFWQKRQLDEAGQARYSQAA